MPTITDDEEGKQVVNQDGDTIGMVSNVEGSRLHVDPDPGITEKIKSKLGWESADEEDYMITEDDIDSVTDDEIRLNW